MAKRRDTTRNIDGLEEAVPSSPTRPPKYSIYISVDNDASGFQFHSSISWCTAYAARRTLDELFRDRKTEVVDRRLPHGTFPFLETTDGDIRVRIDGAGGLAEVMAYEPSDAEREWSLPESALHVLERARGAKFAAEVAADNIVAADDAADVPAPRPQRTKVEREPRPSRDGLVSVGDVAAEMKIDPKDARAALRKANEAKPDAGWAWPKSEVARIKKVIKANLKEKK